MRNCGVRLLPLDFRDQYFGCEIELTGVNRATAAQTLADLFGTRAEHSGGGYDAYRVKDLDGKEWKIVRDGSIHPECRRRSVLIGETYKVELNSPKLEYGEMEKLQEGCPRLTPRRRYRKRQLRNARPCGCKQAHAAEPQKCAVHYVLKRGYFVCSFES